MQTGKERECTWYMGLPVTLMEVDVGLKGGQGPAPASVVALELLFIIFHVRHERKLSMAGKGGDGEPNTIALSSLFPTRVGFISF